MYLKHKYVFKYDGIVDQHFGFPASYTYLTVFFQLFKIPMQQFRKLLNIIVTWTTRFLYTAV